MTNHRRTAFAGTVATLIVVDLAIKSWAVRSLDDSPVELPGPLDLQLSYNDGIAFGLLDRLPAALLICASLVIAALLVRAWNMEQTPTAPTAMIVAGAIANSLDRLESGSVVDMLHLGWWPTFNIADVYITAGVALWAARTIRPALTIGANCP